MFMLMSVSLPESGMARRGVAWQNTPHHVCLTCFPSCARPRIPKAIVIHDDYAEWMLLMPRYRGASRWSAFVFPFWDRVTRPRMTRGGEYLVR